MGVLTDIYDIQNHAEILTEHARTADGKRFIVEYKRGIPGPYTSQGKTAIKLVLPELNSRMTETDVKKLRGWIAHEVAHHTEGHDFWPIMDKLGFGGEMMEESPLAAFMNMLEDNRIEHKASSRYRGDAIAFSDARETVSDEMVKAAASLPGGQRKDMDAMRALLSVDMESRQTWCASDSYWASKFEDAMPPEVKAMSEKLRKAGFVDALRNMQSGQDVLDLSKKAFEMLLEESADEHIKKMQEEAKKRGKGKGSGEGAEGEGEGEGSSKGQGKEGQGKGGKRQSGFVDAQGKTVKYSDFLMSDHGDDAVGGTGIHLDYTDHVGDWSTYTPCPLPDVKVAWFNKGKYSHGGMQEKAEDKGVVERFQGYRNRVHGKDGAPGHGFGNKIRRLLQINSQAHYVGGHKQGRLHKKNAYRIGCKQVGDGQWNQRVFRQKHENDILDVAVTVLTDFSGSMMGDKVAHAIDSAMLLNDSIALSLRVPTEVLGFTEHKRDCMIGVAKEFDERIQTDKLIENLCKTGGFMSNNADGEAILWAHHRLKQRKEKRKILIVLSDGSPASSRGGDSMAFCQKVVKEIEHDGRVEVVGIGIMDDNVKYIYKDHEVIERANELEHALLNVIKRKIIV